MAAAKKWTVQILDAALSKLSEALCEQVLELAEEMSEVGIRKVLAQRSWRTTPVSGVAGCRITGTESCFRPTKETVHIVILAVGAVIRSIGASDRRRSRSSRSRLPCGRRSMSRRQGWGTLSKGSNLPAQPETAYAPLCCSSFATRPVQPV